ncbi:MAG: hypothetical protein F6K47_00995 [Symploca sp. SIO2E6]|nr:hypothetical protein [Symploca sp. SIO2E6]
MRTQDSLWQGCFGYWQNLFIQQNLFSLGYTAWNGYLNTGKGIVVCNVVDTISSKINWEVDRVTFHQEFIPQGQVEAYLQALELQLEAVTALLKAITTYDPNQAIVLLIIGNDVVDINFFYLQNMPITPPQCYQQVCKTWEEFQPAVGAS